MKHLIDFCKTMETSVDPCLSCYCYFGLLMDYCLKSRCLLEWAITYSLVVAQPIRTQH